MSRPKHHPETAEFAAELRLEMPWSERRLWQAIKKQQLGVRFRRQVPIGRYVADFACLSPKLVIEVDGPSHDGADERRRTSVLERKGFTVLRFENEDVKDHLSWVCDQIKETIARLNP